MRRVVRLFPDADDSVVAAAHGVLTGERREGAKGIRRVEREDGTTLVYRLDRYADVRRVGPEAVTGTGESPGSDAVAWCADRGLVESEFERRSLGR